MFGFEGNRIGFRHDSKNASVIDIFSLTPCLCVPKDEIINDFLFTDSHAVTGTVKIPT